MIDEYYKLFTHLAESHKLINHKEFKRGFFRVNMDEIISGSKLNLKSEGSHLGLVDYQFDVSGLNPRRLIDCGFMVLTRYNNGDYDSQLDAFVQSEQITSDFINRLHAYGMQDDPNWASLSSLDHASFICTPIESKSSSKYTGFLTMFKVALPYNCEVDAKKWEDLA